MICKNCNNDIPEDSVFCPMCGAKTEELKDEFCTACGNPLPQGARFCSHCGKDILASPISQFATLETEQSKKSVSGKTVLAYFVGILGIVASLVARIGLSETIRISSLWENKYYVGISGDLKPIVSAIPVLAAMIVSVLLVSDKATPKQKKAVALIVNIVFVILSFLVIWYDLPKTLFY